MNLIRLFFILSVSLNSIIAYAGLVSCTKLTRRQNLLLYGTTFCLQAIRGILFGMNFLNLTNSPLFNVFALLSILYYLFLALYLSKNRRRCFLSCYGIYSAVNALAVMMWGNILQVNNITGGTDHELLVYGLYLLIINLLGTLLSWYVTVLFEKKFNTWSDRAQTICAVPSTIMTAVLLLTSFLDVMKNNLSSMTQIWPWLMLICSLLILLAYITSMDSLKAQQELSEIQNRKLQLEQMNQEQQKELNDYRTQRHENKNHLLALSSLLKREKKEQAKEYAKALIDQVDNKE